MTRQIREDRRAFLRRLQAVVAGGTAFALLPQLDLIGRAMAADALPGNDYKALVCIFLFGGSDSFNMLIPHETGEYRRIRPAAAACTTPRPIPPASAMHATNS